MSKLMNLELNVEQLQLYVPCTVFSTRFYFMLQMFSFYFINFPINGDITQPLAAILEALSSWQQQFTTMDGVSTHKTAVLQA